MRLPDTQALRSWKDSTVALMQRAETREVPARLQCIKCGEECLDRGQDKTICGECA